MRGRSGRGARWLGRETCSSGVGRRSSLLGAVVLGARDRSMFGLGSRSVVLEGKLGSRWAMEVVRYGGVSSESL
jgi:hypothetical protein